jgi:FkbM family methyltransferase
MWRRLASRLEYLGIRVLARVAGTLPWGAGQFRIAEHYAARRRWPKGSRSVQRMRCGALMTLDLSDRTQAIAFLVRDYSPQQVRYILERLPSDGTFLDVGGHVGLVSFAIAVARPDVTIHAFEPNPMNASAWRRNQVLNGSTSAHLTEAGVSDKDGSMGFSLLGDSASGAMREVGGDLVPVVTLDSYCNTYDIQRIDVLKIDVQGHEEAVLRGAHGLLSSGAIATIVCEVNIGDRACITGTLRKYGFEPVAVPELGVRGFLGNLMSERVPEDLAFEPS